MAVISRAKSKFSQVVVDLKPNQIQFEEEAWRKKKCTKCHEYIHSLHLEKTDLNLNIHYYIILYLFHIKRSSE